MPTYAFKCPTCGNFTEQVRPMAEASKPQWCDCGTQMVRDYRYEHGHFRHTPGTWPMYSDAVGVNPTQRKEAYEESVRLGVPTEFNELGQAVFTSRLHRKRYCEAIGFYDKDGGYSDPQRR